MRFEAELDIADATRPRPRPRPRRRHAEGPRLRPRRSTPAAPRPSATSPAPRPPSTSSPEAGPRDAEQRATACPPPARSSSTPTSTPPPSASTTVFGPTGRLEEGQRLVLLDQLKSWCGDSRTKVTIKPVIDLNAHLSTPRATRSPTGSASKSSSATAPACSRGAPAPPAAATSTTSSPTTTTPTPKADHNPAPRSTDNLAALCRFHHRLKTHTAWRYRMTAPGCFEWTSPHGHHYRRDRTGTTAIDRPADPARPGIPRPRRR